MSEDDTVTVGQDLVKLETGGEPGKKSEEASSKPKDAAPADQQTSSQPEGGKEKEAPKEEKEEKKPEPKQDEKKPEPPKPKEETKPKPPPKKEEKPSQQQEQGPFGKRDEHRVRRVRRARALGYH